MPEPTYRIAQRLHARRAAVGFDSYGRHLDANSPGCMIVHAIEEAADLTEYLLAEAQRRREALEFLIPLADSLKIVGDYGFSDTLTTVIDLLGGESALAQYDEILGGGTVAENATVDPRDEALRVAINALQRQRQGLENILEFRKLRTAIGKEERFGLLTRDEIEEVIQQIDTALATIRAAGGAR